MEVAKLKVIFDGSAAGVQAAARTAQKAFEDVTKTSKRTTDALGSSFSGLTGFAGTATGALGKVGGAFNSVRGVAQGAAQSIANGFGAASNAAYSMGGAMTSAGSAITSALLTPVNMAVSAVKGLAYAGAAAVTAFSVFALKGGYSRLTSIEDSTKALTITLGDATKATGLLDEVMKVVTGTPYAFDQFAQGAQRLIAMGIAADKVPNYLRAIGNSAATQGKRASEYVDRLTTVFGQMSAAGKVSGQDMLQFTEAAVPAWAILANHFKVSTGELRSMVTKGLVPAEEATEALVKGIMEGTDGIAGKTAALGGVMEGLAETTSGAWANMKTAVSRFGANALTPVFGSLPNLLGKGTAKIDEMGKKVGVLVQQFVDSKFAKDAVEALSGALKTVGEWARRVAARAKDLDWASIFETTGAALNRHLVEPLKDLWSLVKRVVPPALELASAIREKLATALGSIGADRMDALLRAFTVGAILVGPLLIGVGKLVSAFGFLFSIGQKVFTVISFLLSPVGLAVVAVGALAAAGLWLYNNFEPFADLVDAIVGRLKGFGDVLSNLGVDGIVDTISGAFNGLGSAFKGYDEDTEGFVGSFGQHLETLTGFVENFDIGEALSSTMESAQATFGFLADAASEGVDDTLGHLGRLRDAGGSALSSFGDIASGAFDAVSRNSDSSQKSLGKFTESTSKGASHIADALGSVGDVVAKVFAGIKTWLDDNKELVDKWATKLGGIFAHVGEIIGLAMEAIKEVVELALSIIKIAWDLFGDDIVGALTGVFDNLLSIIDGALKIITGIFDVFIGIFTGDWSRAWDGIKNIFAGVWDIIFHIVAGALALIQGVIGMAFEVIRTVISAAWGAIVGVFQWAWGVATGVVSAGIGGVINLVKAIPGKLLEFASTIFEPIKNAFITVKDWVFGQVGKIPEFFTGLKDKVAEKTRGMFDGLIGAFKGAINAVLGVWNRFKFPKFTIGGWDTPFGKTPTFTTPEIRFPQIPTLHTGGLFDVGGGPAGEGLALLQNNERVLSAGQDRELQNAFKRLGTGSGTTVTFAPVIHADKGTDTAEIQRVLELEMRKLVRELKALGVVPAGV